MGEKGYMKSLRRYLKRNKEFGMEEKISEEEILRKKGEKLIEEVKEELQSFIEKEEGLKIKDEDIKMAFQRVDNSKLARERIGGYMKYTYATWLKELHPKAEEKLKKLENLKNVDEKVWYIIWEGVWIGLNQKKLNNIDTIKNFTLPDQQNIATWDNAFKEIYSSLRELKEPDLKWDGFKNEIEKKYKTYRDEIPEKENLHKVLKELLLKIPQQSLRTGFSPDIFFRTPNIHSTEDYIKDLRGINFFGNFSEKVKEKAQTEIKKIIDEWIEYNILTNIEFYFHGAPHIEKSNSVFAAKGVKRIDEPFGLFYIFINYSENENTFDPKCVEISVYNFLRKKMIDLYIEKFNIYLHDEFMIKVRRNCLKEIKEKGKVENIEKLIESIHDEERLISINNNLETKKSSNSEWEFKLEKILKESQIFIENLKEVQKIIGSYALKSAVAAIMARNMSHNIGSHILVYLKMADLLELAVRFVNKDKEGIEEIKNLCKKIEELGSITQNIAEINKSTPNDAIKKCIDKLKEETINKINEIKNILQSLTGSSLRWGLAEWIKDTQTFFGYLQHRMDFLAQISTEWPEWTFSAYLMKDIMREFLSQRHFLDGIAKSEGLRGFYYDWETPYNNYLEIKQKHSQASQQQENYGRIKFHVINLGKIGSEKASEKWHYEISTTPECIQSRINEFKNKKINEKKYLRILLCSDEKNEIEPNIQEGDIPIAIPGGIVGYHAFYVLFENIIRNSAKHSYIKMKETLKEWAELKLYLDNKLTDEMKKELKKILILNKDDELTKYKENLKNKFKDKNNEDLEKKLNENETLLKMTFGENFSTIQDFEIVIEFTDTINDKPVTVKEKTAEGKEKEVEGYLFRIYDNVSKTNRISNKNDKKFRVFPKDLKEDEKTPEKDLVAFMNECFRHSIIKETGELDKRHWGMAEMKIAAGYLQGRTIQDIGASGDKITGSEDDQEGKEDFIIRAIESPIGTLGFEFRVKKPKEVGIVCYKK